MSTLVAQTISNGTVSTSSENVIRGSARAWVNFDGTGTPTIRASYNVSSITDNGTGDFTVNFTNALPDANYVTTCFNGRTTGNTVVNTAKNLSRTSTASLVHVVCIQASTIFDGAEICVAIFD
jgi:hypothetical protein